MEEKRVIIDVDPALGIPLRDVDDAFAVMLLLAEKRVKLEAVTVNFGNAPAPRGFDIAKELLSVAGVRVPLFKGANSRRDLGVPNPAVEHMLKAANANPGKISLLAVAPLTNVATAMLLDPGFAAKLRELVVMGGSLAFKPFSEKGEFNFKCDPVAASIVLAAPVRKTLITMDVCSHAIFTRRHLKMLRSSGRPAASHCARHVPLWLLVNQLYFRGSGFYPWDPVAAAWVIDPSLFDENPCDFKVQTEGRAAGRVLEFKRLRGFAAAQGRIPVNVPLRLDGKRFMSMFMDRIMSL